MSSDIAKEIVVRSPTDSRASGVREEHEVELSHTRRTRLLAASEFGQEADPHHLLDALLELRLFEFLPGLG